MALELPSDLNLLLALDVFLRERHVTRAAKRLAITQSAASQRLAKLRDHFGDALLAPGRPLLALTPRAQALLEPLASALASLRAALRAGAPFDPAVSQRRFVLLGDDLVEALAMPLLGMRLLDEAPQVSISVERADTDLVTRLERGSADLAFLPQMLLVPSLRRLPLPEEPFVVLMRKGHPAARGRLTLDRYLELGHVLVAPRGMPGSLVNQALERLGRQRRITLQVQHFTSLPFILSRSDLIVTCPAVLRPLCEPFEIVERRPPLELGVDRVFAVWHERVDNDPGHRWLRQSLASALKARKREK